MPHTTTPRELPAEPPTDEPTDEPTDGAVGPVGHLFVVHGRVESLTRDVAVVPVDRWLHFEPHWDAVLGDAPRTRPATWDAGWGWLTDDVLIVEVGLDDDYGRVLDRLTTALESVAARPRPESPRGRRPLPLVALPYVGIGAGGHAHERGAVVGHLLDHLAAQAARLGVDVALVTPDAAVHAAAQARRRGTPGPLEPALESLARELGAKARAGSLALLLGAGVSIPADLPSWDELLTKLLEGIHEGSAGGEPAAGFGDLPATDKAAYIAAVSPEGFQQRVAAIARGARAPSLLHALLAGLGAHEVVTTNYDTLYEQAVAATGVPVQRVLPRGRTTGGDRWVLKLHGDVDEPGSIVLTRSHMVRYDAANRPSAALLQSLLLTRHLLVVGASLTDDNVVRLALEVEEYRRTHQPGAPQVPFGTVLDASGTTAEVRGTLWRDQLDWRSLATPAPGGGFRVLELLLDRVGVHASDDASWLLDPRFADLLPTDEDRRTAARARELLAHLPADDETWRPLRARLVELGGPAGTASPQRP